MLIIYANYILVTFFGPLGMLVVSHTVSLLSACCALVRCRDSARSDRCG
jgi:hypothetical protein